MENTALGVGSHGKYTTRLHLVLYTYTYVQYFMTDAVVVVDLKCFHDNIIHFTII